MNFDEIFEELGELGSYQKRIFYMIVIANYPMVVQTFGAIFTMATSSHRCQLPGMPEDCFHPHDPVHANTIKQWVPWDDDEDAYSACKLYKQDNRSISNATESCSHYVYDHSQYESSFVSDIDMVCDDEDLSTYASLIYTAGLLFGSIIIGCAADNYGRKKTIVMSTIAYLVVAIGLAFVHSYEAFVALRFFIGFFGVGVLLTGFTMAMELAGPRRRKYTGSVYLMFWVVSSFILILMAYFIRYWTTLQIVCSATGVILLFLCFFIPESPRWLLTRGGALEARKILGTIAQKNNVTLSEKWTNIENIECDGVGTTICTWFKNKTLAGRALIIFFNWFVVSFVYYGLNLNVDPVSDNIYANLTYGNLVELAGYILCFALLNHTGRRPILCFSMLLAGVACLGTMFPILYGDDDLDWVTLALSLIGKFGASAAFAMVYIYSAELFPTSMRASGMGLSSLCARIGGTISPYVGDLADVVDGKDMGVALPLIVFGGLCVLAGLLALFLPETTFQKLPDTIEDAIDLGKKETDIIALKERSDKGKDNPALKI